MTEPGSWKSLVSEKMQLYGSKKRVKVEVIRLSYKRFFNFHFLPKVCPLPHCWVCLHFQRDLIFRPLLLDVDRFKSKTNLKTTKEDEIGILSKLLALPGPLYAMVYYHKSRKVNSSLKFSLSPTLMPQLLVKLNTKREGTWGYFKIALDIFCPPLP